MTVLLRILRKNTTIEIIVKHNRNMFGTCSARIKRLSREYEVLARGCHENRPVEMYRSVLPVPKHIWILIRYRFIRPHSACCIRSLRVWHIDKWNTDSGSQPTWHECIFNVDIIITRTLGEKSPRYWFVCILKTEM